jgi:hypothetical protein
MMPRSSEFSNDLFLPGLAREHQIIEPVVQRRVGRRQTPAETLLFSFRRSPLG